MSAHLVLVPLTPPQTHMVLNQHAREDEAMVRLNHFDSLGKLCLGILNILNHMTLTEDTVMPLLLR